MMFRFLLVLVILDAFLLITVVLLQAGKGGGLASLGGGSSTDSVLGGRQATTILTKLSWWCGGIFLGLTLVLAGLSSRTALPTSVLEQGIAPPTPVAPLPLDGGTQQGAPGLGGVDGGSEGAEPADPTGN